MGILILASLFLTLVFIPETVEPAVCAVDYMPVMEYRPSHRQCNQKIWRNFQLLPDSTIEYALPDQGLEGWTLNFWRMCLNGTLGFSSKSFVMKFLGSDDTLAIAKASYKKMKSKFVLNQYKNGQKTNKSKSTAKPSPLSAGSEFHLVAELNNHQLKYTFCGETCATAQQNLTDTNVKKVQLKFEANVTALDLWCL